MLTCVQEPKAYIEALLDVHGKYKEVVDVCFKAELGFNASLDRVSSSETEHGNVADSPGMPQVL